MSQKRHFMIFKIRYNVELAAPGHVAVDSMADLSTQHGDMPYQKRKGMSMKTAQAVLSSATQPGAAILTMYLIMPKKNIFSIISY